MQNGASCSQDGAPNFRGVPFGAEDGLLDAKRDTNFLKNGHASIRYYVGIRRDLLLSAGRGLFGHWEIETLGYATHSMEYHL